MQDLLESNKKPFQMKIWKLLRAIRTFYKMTFLVQTIIIKHIKRGWLIITRRNVGTNEMVIVHTKVKYYCVMLSNNNFGVTALFLFCFCTRVIAFLSNRISSHIAIYNKNSKKYPTIITHEVFRNLIYIYSNQSNTKSYENISYPL